HRDAHRHRAGPAGACPGPDPRVRGEPRGPAGERGAGAARGGARAARRHLGGGGASVMTPLRSLLRSVRRRLGLDVPPFYRRYPPRFPVSVIDFRISIDHAARFCYFRIPKAANTTIIARLYMEQNGLREVDPSRLPDIKLNGYTRPSRLSRAEVDRVMSSYFTSTF